MNGLTLELNGRTATDIIFDRPAHEVVRRLAAQGRVVIITDANVHRLYGSLVEPCENIVIGMGETTKTLTTVERIYRSLTEMAVDRSCFIIGIGGGIVTDITGFAASTFMRGVRFGFIPTTLLAQVDAAVGGKNGVNLDGFKNMVGCFRQPDFVLCDPSLLESLPEREFRGGLAEMLKAGIIGDTALFDHLADAGYGIRSDKKKMSEAIRRSVSLKVDIVSHDETEQGNRILLNLGHTFAHAYESISDRLTHGEAVAAGISMAAKISEGIGILDAEDACRIRQAVEKCGLPTSFGVPQARLFRQLHGDKKKNGESIKLILPERIGECFVKEMPLADIKQILENHFPQGC